MRYYFIHNSITKRNLYHAVLSRDYGESIRIADNIKVIILSGNNSQVKLGIEAPKDITVHRLEIYEKIMDDRADK